MQRLLCAIALCLLGSPARAQAPPPSDPDNPDGIVGSGPESGPGPEEDLGPPRIETDDDARRAVRGAPIERPTSNPSREALRAFEREAFGPGPGAPRDGDLAGPPDGERGVRKGELPANLRSP